LYNYQKKKKKKKIKIAPSHPHSGIHDLYKGLLYSLSRGATTPPKKKITAKFKFCSSEVAVYPQFTTVPWRYVHGKAKKKMLSEEPLTVAICTQQFGVVTVTRKNAHPEPETAALRVKKPCLG
jgi:hypothetical protein